MNVVPVQDVVEFQTASHQDSLDDGVFLESLRTAFPIRGPTRNYEWLSTRIDTKPQTTNRNVLNKALTCAPFTE